MRPHPSPFPPPSPASSTAAAAATAAKAAATSAAATASSATKSASLHLRRFLHTLATRVLDLDVNATGSRPPPHVLQRATDLLGPAEIYLETEPSVADWLKHLAPSRADALGYVKDLFPSASWIRRYNIFWLLGDGLAGLTIGLVVVPQALAYASLAYLPPSYGLYTSFTGAVIYWVFGTSRDIVIGTTAVGSLLVGRVVSRVAELAGSRYGAVETAHALSLLSGSVLLFLGLSRLGWIVEFIPYIPISSFVTAASITIMLTQMPVVLGIPDIETREPPYRVMLAIIRRLAEMRLDAAVGLSSIVLLFAIRNSCTLMQQRRPDRHRLWALLSSLRLTFTVLLFTLISYLVHRSRPMDEPKFRIVGKIDRGRRGPRADGVGFQQLGMPHPDSGLIRIILSELPTVAVVLVIEHIAIAKAMGRLHRYTVDPSQEMVALGAANMLSPLVGGYVCTGSFGASAVLSKAGVRTPLAGLFSALVLVLALYSLTAVFYYIPKAALAGLIIHAVCNLLTSPRSLYRYWLLSPAELLIWLVGVALAMVLSLEACIYGGVILSMLLLLFRLARTRGTFLGVARARRVPVADKDRGGRPGHYGDVFLPLAGEPKSAANPEIRVESPHPGVFVYRLNEGFNYTNQAFHADALVGHVMKNTTRASQQQSPGEEAVERLWNEAGPAKERGGGGVDGVDGDGDGDGEHIETPSLPPLRAVVLDFAAVNNVDVTSVQGLIDMRNSFDRYSWPDTVEWHFAHVRNRWTRRALAIAGFGYPVSRNPEAVGRWQPIYCLAATLVDADAEVDAGDGAGGWRRAAALGGARGGVGEDEERTRPPTTTGTTTGTATLGTATTTIKPKATMPEPATNTKMQPKEVEAEGHLQGGSERMASVYGVDRPFFHDKLEEAVESAVSGARCRDESLGLRGSGG